ncbi:sensor histidine kinase, partial [Streptomyces sp. SID7804]|nr:sensor histidine kinase [Streptomyces sp. SID7804]
GRRGGRGLLLVNLIADLVRVHTGDDGTTIRCWFPRRRP